MCQSCEAAHLNLKTTLYKRPTAATATESFASLYTNVFYNYNTIIQLYGLLGTLYVHIFVINVSLVDPNALAQPGGRCQAACNCRSNLACTLRTRISACACGSMSSHDDAPSSSSPVPSADAPAQQLPDTPPQKPAVKGKPKKEYRQIQMPSAEQIVQEDMMNNCGIRTVMSGVMGMGLGVLFGVVMGTMDAGVSLCSILLNS